MVKDKVAIIGAGGIGFDVAELLVSEEESNDDWYEKWRIDTEYLHRGGVTPEADHVMKIDASAEETADDPQARKVYLLQRKDEKPGNRLAKTTGWIRRVSLRRAGVEMMQNVTYEKIDDFGLHIRHQGERLTLAVDNVIVCAGQESNDDLYQQLRALGRKVYVIGGAKKAAELDAETAIRDGLELAYSL
jgi:2,4-dienoyl-CoA reductase (NADPH2)